MNLNRRGQYLGLDPELLANEWEFGMGQESDPKLIVFGQIEP